MSFKICPDMECDKFIITGQTVFLLELTFLPLFHLLNLPLSDFNISEQIHQKSVRNKEQID